MSVATLDHWVDGRRDVQQRNIRHAIRDRLSGYPERDGAGHGWAWMSERLLFKTICRCSWSEGLELVMECIAEGEFYRVTARGRGCGKGRTLYFYGWVRPDIIKRQLEENRMPLAAFHAAERFIADYRARLFFRRKNGAGEHQLSPPQEGGTTKKDGRFTPDRPLRASHDPPPVEETQPARRPHTPSDGRLPKHGLERPSQTPSRPWNPLNHHGERLRQLREKALGADPKYPWSFVDSGGQSPDDREQGT